jgi:hypothetical protein
MPGGPIGLSRNEMNMIFVPSGDQQAAEPEAMFSVSIFRPEPSAFIT